MTTELSSQIAVAAVITWVLESLKNWEKIPWLSDSTPTINRIVAIAMSALGALGISCKYDKDVGSLLCTGITLTSMGHFLWTWLSQYAITHWFYKGTQ